MSRVITSSVRSTFSRHKRTDMKRREFLGLSLAGAAAGLPGTVLAQSPNDAVPKELRVGYQKTGVLVITRRRGVLEEARDVAIRRVREEGVGHGAARWYRRPRDHAATGCRRTSPLELATGSA